MKLYVAAGKDGVMRAVWDAQPYSPAGIVVGHEPVWEQYSSSARATESVIPYTRIVLDGINDKTNGYALR